MPVVMEKKEQNFDVNNSVVLERRETIPEIVDYLNNTIDRFISIDHFIEEVFDEDKVATALEESLPNSTSKDNKKVFIKDIVRLCRLFFTRTKSKRILLHIEVVTSDMCRFFHVDNYRQRLLCTYIGPGTEWLDHSNVNRQGLGKGCNNRIVRDFNKINRANEFDVLLLQGLKYGEGQLGVAHRSPPIEKEAKTRVLLKIDER